MTPTLTIRVPGDPVAWARSGRRMMRGKDGQPFVQSFTPRHVQTWMDHVSHFAQTAAQNTNWQKPDKKTPLSVQVDFHLRRVTGCRKTDHWKYTAPDNDNYIILASLWAGFLVVQGMQSAGRTIRPLVALVIVHSFAFVLTLSDPTGSINRLSLYMVRDPHYMLGDCGGFRRWMRTVSMEYGSVRLCEPALTEAAALGHVCIVRDSASGGMSVYSRSNDSTPFFIIR